LLTFTLGVSIVMALLGVAQHYDVGSIPFYDFLQANPRLDITLGNPTFVGAYMLVNALIGLGFLGQSFLQKSPPRQQASRASERRRQRRRRAQSSSVNYSLISWRLFWLAAIALDLWILSLTGTRGAFLGLGAGLMAFAVVYIVIGRVVILRFAASGLIGLLALVALIFVFGKDTAIFERVAESNVMIRRVSTIGLTDSTLVSRLDSISAGLEGFAARPILGWGPENYNVAFGRYIKVDSRATETFDQVHSKPIEELTTKGALGFLSYMTLWAFMFWVVFRKARRQDAGEQFFTLFIGATLVGYFVQNLFLFDTPATLLQFILLLGYVVTLEITMIEPAAEGRREDAAKRQAPMAWLDNLIAPVRVRFQGSERIKRLGRASIFSSELRFMYGLVVMVGIVGLSVFFFNYRPYSAAAYVVDTNSVALTWQQRLGFFDKSIDSFRPLANYPRLILFIALKENWDTLTVSEATEAMAMVEIEAKEAIESEPQNWRIYVALGSLYQSATSLDTRYLDVAESYIGIAGELAPGRFEVYELRARQLLANKKYSEAQATIAEFLELNPRAEFRFSRLLDEIEQAGR
ncbi:MAG: O-antigen ligase family protein, partial [Chloroflexi bacterium]|nr:O-antigen ligase family protein [Chloroflexota bacterium]